MSNFANGQANGLASGMVNDYLIGGSFNPGFTDNTPRLNAIYAEMQEGDVLQFPPRYCGFRSAPNSMPDGVMVIGSGAKSCPVKHYQSGEQDFFFTTAIQDGISEDLEFFIGDGFSGGIAIGRRATNPNDAPQKTTLRNITTTNFGSGAWYGGCMIDGLAGEPHYGARIINMSDCFFHSCGLPVVGGFGLSLRGVNIGHATNLGVALNISPAWGVWLIGMDYQPLQGVNLHGVLNTSVLMYGAHSSAVYAASLGQVIIDNACVSNSVHAGFLDPEPPIVGGVNNHVFANGKEWPPRP